MNIDSGNVKIQIGNGMGGSYGLGVIGAAIYFLQHSAGFWPSALAILKALVWPAALVYGLLDFLKI
jgi:hypothetical protein